MLQTTLFMWNKRRFSIIFLSTIRKCYYEILVRNGGGGERERIFLNRRLRMKVYIMIVWITALE